MKKLFNKYKVLILFFICLLVFSAVYSSIVSLRVSKSNGITIVVDAGHGGRDGGSVGIGGTIEKEINLEYALALKNKLVENGYNVVLTRKNDDGLYSEFAKNKKQSDMNERFKIIKQANPNLVISIHMNSFRQASAYGATTYYRKDDKASQYVGDLIQKSLKNDCNAKYEKSKVGDYYMLNCSYYTAVLIECGFISNPEEEKLLNDETYKNKIVNAIFNGVLLYFGQSNSQMSAN